MTTKTNNDMDRYAAAEAIVAEAKAKHDRAEANISKAISEGDALRNRLRNGDESVTAVDLAAAQYGEERATLLMYAAKAAWQRADRNQLVRPIVANGLAAFFADIFGEDVAVEVVDALPALPEKAPAEPILYVRQTKRTQHDRESGIVSAELEMAYVRRDLFAKADWEKVERKAEDEGFQIEIHSRGTSDKGKVRMDRAAVIVHRAFPEDMTLTGQTPNYRYAIPFIGAIGNEGTSGRPGTSVAVTEPGHVSIKTNAKGGRVEHEITVRIEVHAGKRGKLDGAFKSMTQALNAQVGRPFAGLGHCTSVEVLDGRGVQDSYQSMTAKATFTAKVA